MRDAEDAGYRHDSRLLDKLDALIADRRFSNRSQAIEAALAEKLARLVRTRLARTRLAREAAKLHPREEKALAEECIAAKLRAWHEY